jgi:hypothetical protein
MGISMEEKKHITAKDDCGIIVIGNYNDNAYIWQTGGMSCSTREVRGKIILCKQMNKNFRKDFRNFTSELSRHHVGCMYSDITDINIKNNKEIDCDKLSNGEIKFIKDKILEFKLPFRLLTDKEIMDETHNYVHNTEAAIFVQNLFTKNYYCIWYNNCD